MQDNMAYDFDYFSNVAEKREPEKKLRVLTNKNYKKQTLINIRTKEMAVLVTKTLILTVLVFVLLSLQAKANEINACISTTKSSTVEVDSALDYYENSNRKVSLKEIEDYALSQGMIKADIGNTTYVQLETENSILVQPTRFQIFLSEVKEGVQTCIDFLDKNLCVYIK